MANLVERIRKTAGNTSTLEHHSATQQSSVSSMNISLGAMRNRPRRPCDACRKRKSRCEMSEGETSCVLCKFHRQPCLFQQDPQPRKKRKMSNVDTHETNGSRDHQRGLPPLETADGPGSSEVIDRRASIRNQQPIDDYANLKGPSLLKKTLGLQSQRHSRFLGSTSIYEQTLLNAANADDNYEIPLGQTSIRKVNDSTSFLLRPDAETRNRDEEIRDLDSIEMLVAPHGQALISLYFRIAHPIFPILHKKVFLEKYSRTHREFSPPLLAAVYILALNWWSYSSDLALLQKPDVAQLERLATKTMSYIVLRPKISTVQAGMLLLNTPGGDSWALTGQLVALGQELGLHLDCSKWKIPAWERGLRKRLAWALYMQDKWGSLVHARPSHITPADWLVKPVTEADFPERAADEDDEEGSTEVEKGRILFCEMIRLTEIVTLILSGFYSLRAEEETRERLKDGGRWVLERAKPVQLRLKDWYQQLPECLKMDNVKMRKLNSVGYLHLAYLTAEMTLHRQILRSLAHEHDMKLVAICRSAAKSRLTTVMEFVRSLRAEHLQSFWYSSSEYCFAAVGTFIGLLWITASSHDEAEGYKQKLEEYRWTLRLSSKSADFLDRAISQLTSSTGLLMKAIPDGSRPPTSNTESPLAGTAISQQEEEEDEEGDDWAGYEQNSVDETTSMQPSPTSYSEHTTGLDWETFASYGNNAFPVHNNALQDASGFSMQPFLGIGEDFDIPSAYQPHYGT